MKTKYSRFLALYSSNPNIEINPNPNPKKKSTPFSNPIQNPNPNHI